MKFQHKQNNNTTKTVGKYCKGVLRLGGGHLNDCSPKNYEVTGTAEKRTAANETTRRATNNLRNKMFKGMTSEDT